MADITYDFPAVSRNIKILQQKVQMLIEDEDERDILYQALRGYKQNMSVEELVSNLKMVLNDPKRMILYEEIRPLIPLKHQMTYDKYVPKQPSEKIRVIRLVKQGNDTFGFSVRGGVEHGVGIFVSDVIPDSQASIKGLKVGDQVVRVNGFNISQATHDEVLSLIHSKRYVTLKVKTVGMIPVKNKKNDPLTWKYVQGNAPSMLEDVINEAENVDNDDDNIRKLYVNLVGGMTLGCSIASIPGQPEIFIQYVKPHSLAEQIGIKPGDQLLEVNGHSFLGITHAEAVVVLKSSKQLTITLKKGAADFEIYSAPSRIRRVEKDRERESEQAELKQLREEALKREREKQLRLDMERAEADRKHEEEKALREQMKKSSVTKPEDEKEKRKSDDKWNQLFLAPPKARADSRTSQTSIDPDIESEQIAQELLNLSLQQEQLEKEKNKETLAASQEVKTDNISVQEQWKLQREQIEKDMEMAKKFSDREIDGREIRVLKIQKDGPLEILIEGGIDSPIGRLVVSEVYEGGAAWRHGGLYKGDQIMMVDGRKMTDVKLSQAEQILKEAMITTDKNAVLEMVIAVAPAKNYEDEITFF